MIGTFSLTVNQPPTATRLITFGHEIVNNVENTLFFLYMTFTLSQMSWDDLNVFLIDEFDAVVFVLAKHVCICVYSFLYHLSWHFHWTVKYEQNT